MSGQMQNQSYSRRNAVLALGATGLGVALANAPAEANAQSQGLGAHPLTGTWLSMADDGVSVYQFVADGTVNITCPTCRANQDGEAEFSTSGIGTWQQTGARSGYFNVVHVLSTAAGAFAGSRSVHGFPVVAEDGSALAIDGSGIRIYVQNEQNILSGVIGGDRSLASISAVRMRPGSPGFPSQYGSPAEQ